MGEGLIAKKGRQFGHVYAVKPGQSPQYRGRPTEKDVVVSFSRSRTALHGAILGPVGCDVLRCSGMRIERRGCSTLEIDLQSRVAFLPSQPTGDEAGAFGRHCSRMKFVRRAKRYDRQLPAMPSKAVTNHLFVILERRRRTRGRACEQRRTRADSEAVRHTSDMTIVDAPLVLVRRRTRRPRRAGLSAIPVVTG